MQKSAFGRLGLTIGVMSVQVAALTFAGSDTARASALTDEARAGLVKRAEEACFDGQSKQEANKSRKPEVLHALCYCFGEKMSYTMTMERLIAAFGKPVTSTPEEDRLMRTVFDNCWQVHVK